MESVYFGQGKLGRERENGNEITCKINVKQSGSTVCQLYPLR